MPITRIICMYGKSAPSTYVIIMRGGKMSVYNPCAKILNIVASVINNYPFAYTMISLGKHGMTASFYTLACETFADIIAEQAKRKHSHAR